MQKIISLRLLPSEAANTELLTTSIAHAAGVTTAAITGYTILKQSIDARSKQPLVQLSIQAFINEPFRQRALLSFSFKNVHTSKHRTVIVGAGPAGLFAALRLLEAGIKPVILERGKNIRDRRRDLAVLNKQGIVNPESNYCFGEGGAGTYSDGKLYTRSSKRGDVNRILNLFVRFGADEAILYDAHPHIGTNKLPHIITAMRQQILDSGGEFLFEKKATGLVLQDGRVTGIKTADKDVVEGEAFVLATGHSARDIFEMLHSAGLLIEAKPFALGIRVEHPQELIDSVQYHQSPGVKDPFLPPASYSLVQQVGGKGVFSFCMCPGGIIAPAATGPGELVVNGWSPSKRNNPYANSGIVVTVSPEDVLKIGKWAHMPEFPNDPLMLVRFQEFVEKRAFEAGGGNLVAPAQRMTDFTQQKISSSLPGCSYLPGIHSVPLASVLPPFIYQSIREAFTAFGKKMHGYYTDEAVVVATESRTSSPVRIPRHPESLQHPQLKNFYPCGEGAGYAGGIVSAAMDGEKCAERIIQAVGAPL